MSASQQKRNKDLHKHINQLESQVEDLQDKVKHLLLENAALRELIPQAFRDGAHARVAYGANRLDTSLAGWLKHKGLT